MRSRGRLTGRQLAIPLLGALATAALALNFAWSQAPTPAPSFGPGSPPPSESLDSESHTTEAHFVPGSQPSESTTSEEITPLEQEELEDYTVPLRQPSDGIVLESEDGLISLVARNAELQDVLTALAETQGLNLITQETVSAQLNTTLHRVPFQDVLDVILSTSGYTWVINRNVIQVTSVSDAQNLPPETQGRQVEVFQLDYVSATDVSSVVSTMLSSAGSANVVESSETDNRRTQEILVVQDLPGYLENIRRYIRKHDVPPRQVLIEAYILKVELSDDVRHGVNFDHIFNLSNNIFQIESRGFANPAATQGFVVNLSGGNLAAVVECLENTTDAKTLASPKIRVINGQTARIQVGEQLGFRVTTTTETSTTESVEFLDVGVVLEVTPRIGNDGTVIMRVSPEVSSGQVNSTTGLPEEETTELQTDVMFRDNQAYVIGGLIQETDTDVQQKLPWLGDLKYVGHLFQRWEVVKRRSEVIIALLPRVMPFDPVTNDRLLIETERATTPLLHGALHEFPRPWEHQLPHVVKNPNLLRLPPVQGYMPFKREDSIPLRPHRQPLDSVLLESTRESLLPRDIGPPPVYTSRLPVVSGRIGAPRISRLPATAVTQPRGGGFTAPSSGTMLR